MRRALLAAVATALMVPGLAQAAGQSLPDTIRFVHDEMTAQGAIAYATGVHDNATNQQWANQMVVVATNFSEDPANCQLSFHWRTTVDGNVVTDSDSGVPFSTIKYVDVVSMAEDTQHNVASAHPTWSISVTPPIWVVSVIRSDGTQNALDFRDHDTAEAVGQAVRHGAELCKR